MMKAMLLLIAMALFGSVQAFGHAGKASVLNLSEKDGELYCQTSLGGREIVPSHRIKTTIEELRLALKEWKPSGKTEADCVQSILWKQDKKQIETCHAPGKNAVLDRVVRWCTQI